MRPVARRQNASRASLNGNTVSMIGLSLHGAIHCNTGIPCMPASLRIAAGVRFKLAASARYSEQFTADGSQPDERHEPLSGWLLAVGCFSCWLLAVS